MSDNRYRRKAPFLQPKEEVLIVCGGQTEQLYFDAFKQVFRPSLGNINIITAIEAKSPTQIVEFALKTKLRKDNYNAIWCVFDKDDFIDFDDAISLAQRSRIGVAFSNQAFEVWFINHFRPMNSAMPRKRHKDELAKLLSFPYDKVQGTIEKVLDVLLTEERVKMAIANARFGHEQHMANTKPARPSAYESSTTVYQLAKSLLNWAE